MTPEHLHIALNHLPFLDSGLEVFPIIVGIVFRHKATLLTGLALAALCGWVTPLVMSTGETAAERYEAGAVRPFLDANVIQALELHEERAEVWSKVLYASAIVATLALGITCWSLAVGRVVAIMAVLLGLAALGAGMWIAESGGQIRRPDFRATTGPGAALAVPAPLDKD